jgi:serpin B
MALESSRINQHGQNLMMELEKEKANFGKNIAISAVSTHVALTMAFLGTRPGQDGPNHMEMAHVLAMPEIKSMASLAGGMASLRSKLNSSNPTMRLATAQVIDNKLALHDEFVSLTNQMGARVFRSDFRRASDTLKITNSWSNDETKGMIPEILSDLDPSAVAILLAAVYFKGSWAVAFDAEFTTKQKFSLRLKDKSVQVDMMRQTGSPRFEYFGNAEVQIVRLPYEGETFSATSGSSPISRFAMYVILPAKDKEASGALLDEKVFGELRGKMSNKEVDVSMPRFKVQASYELSDTLKNMGMRTAFVGGFPAMSPAHLFVSSVIHKAVVEVNEEGTEAAAVTAAVMAGESGSRAYDFTADRPFAWVIRDDQNGINLFQGVMNNPAEAA